MSEGRETQEHLTVKEASERLYLSEGRVRQLLREGKLRGTHRTGRKWLIPRTEIDRFLGSDATHGKVDPEAHRQALVALAIRYRDDLFQREVLCPSRVVEDLIRARWEGNERLSVPPWRRDPRWGLLGQHLEGSEAWEILQAQEATWRQYLWGCEELRGHLLDQVITASGLVVGGGEPLEPGKAPGMIYGWLRSSRLEEYLGETIAVAIAWMMEGVDDMDLMRFRHLSRDLKARPSVVVAQAKGDGSSDLWWGDLLVGRVKDTTWPKVEEALKRIAESQAASPLWRNIVDAYDRLTNRRWGNGGLKPWQDLLLDERLTALIANGRCHIC